MVLPEDTPRSGEPKPKRKSIVLGLGTLALVVGAVAVGAMTSPGPIAVGTTTTTPSSTTSLETPETPIEVENFTVDQIAVGEPLVWERTKVLVEGFPIGLANHNGMFYLLATPSSTAYSAGSGGLRIWRSETGATWEYLGEGIPPGHEIISVAATGDGLIVATSDEDRQSLALWQSSDGVVWETHTVPIEDDPLARVGYSSITSNDETIVVFSYLDLAVDELISERMGQIEGGDLAAGYWGWGIDDAGSNPTFTLWGPFGFPLAEVTVDDLGLSDAEVERVRRWNNGEETGSILWTRDPTGVWAQVEIPEADWIDSISVTGDGRFVANGGDATGNTAWTSVDGVTWAEMSNAFHPWRMVPWGERLVGPTSMNRASMLVSDDGDTWTDIGPGDLFPSQLQWSINDVAAGPGGIVGSVIGWSTGSPVEAEPVPAPTLRDGGTILTVDYELGRLTVVAGAEAYTWTMYEPTAPEGIEVDLTSGLILFSDPETGEPLGQFSFEDIRSAEESYWSQGWTENETRALVFSPDGAHWTIQDPIASFGEKDLVQAMVVGETSVVAVTYSVEGLFDPTSAPGFTVWAASIP